jgi:hypothetical protein
VNKTEMESRRFYKIMEAASAMPRSLLLVIRWVKTSVDHHHQMPECQEYSRKISRVKQVLFFELQCLQCGCFVVFPVSSWRKILKNA